MMRMGDASMATLDETAWQALLPALRRRCPRLSPEDLAGCARRTDLLAGRIQNRQWISRVEAGRLIAGLLQEVRR